MYDDHQKALIRARNERARRARIARGLCVQCSNDPAPGRRLCWDCLEKLRDWRQGWRRDARMAGNCVQCGKPARPGSKHCERHLEARKLQNWRQRERLRDAVGEWPRRVRAIRARVRTLRRLLALRTFSLKRTYAEPFSLI